MTTFTYYMEMKWEHIYITITKQLILCYIFEYDVSLFKILQYVCYENERFPLSLDKKSMGKFFIVGKAFNIGLSFSGKIWEKKGMPLLN